MHTVLLLFFTYLTSVAIAHNSLSIGQAKYSEGFNHFDYVNPNAPRGGRLRQIAYGSYDNLNPFILQGIAASGLGSTFDSLAIRSLDEMYSVYGLIAASIDFNKAEETMTITIRPEARFQNNTKVTAQDVITTFYTLKENGHPYYQQYYQAVRKINTPNEHTVVYHLDPKLSNPETPLILCQMPVLSHDDLTTRDFASPNHKPLLGTGPYRIASTDPGRQIRYERDPNYWGMDLPVNRGRHNVDTIEIDYYRDAVVALTAFKNHHHDIHFEYVAKLWATGYDGEALDNGWIVQESIPDQNPQGMQAFAMNLNNPIFQDKKVRKALNYAFNFAWLNSNLFYNSYTRTESYFANSVFAAQGLPSASEQALLKPYFKSLDQSLFTQNFSLPAGDATGNNRSNLLIAKKLLEESGWVIKNHKRVHHITNKPMSFTLLIQSQSMQRISLPFKESLEKLGITMHIHMVSPSTWIRKMKEHDFDMTSYVWPQSSFPGKEQSLYWHSRFANQYGSDNIMALQDPIVDALVEQLGNTDDVHAVKNQTRALDRVLLAGYYVIPHWYLPAHRVAYWHNLAHPSQLPIYGIDLASWWHSQDT